MKTKKSKIKTTNEIKTKTKMPVSSDKKTGFKPKDWVVKLIKKHKGIVDGLKDR